MNQPLKLHIGCGPRFIPGFTHIDIQPAPHVDHVSAADDLSFLADGSASLIYASHLLEHFGRWEQAAVLKEWFRVLTPGGVLRVAVPDFAACAKLYYEQGLENGLSGLVGLISGGQRDRFDYHKMIFDEPFLTKLLREAGFRGVRRWDWRLTEHASIDDYSQAYLPHLNKETGTLMSLNLEGVK